MRSAMGRSTSLPADVAIRTPDVVFIEYFGYDDARVHDPEGGGPSSVFPSAYVVKL